jgi:biopolymer transport protein ExbB/TolQ
MSWFVSSPIWFCCYVVLCVLFIWRTYKWRKLKEQVEELKAELDALHEAFHQSEKAREKAITERENMKRERDEYQTLLKMEERLTEEWKDRYQQREAAIKNALGIRS